jgi:hypothetical protein
VRSQWTRRFMLTSSWISRITERRAVRTLTASLSFPRAFFWSLFLVKIILIFFYLHYSHAKIL